MADSTLSRLLQIVASGETKELRHAALTVLGSVCGAAERNVVKTLVATLDDEDQDLRMAAIEALGQLHAEEALTSLERFVRQGGLELEAAVQAASQMGNRGAKLMGKVMNDVSPSVRTRIGAVLAKGGTGNALVITAQGLLDDDAKVIDATARSLATEAPTYSPPQRHALAKFLIESLGDKKLPSRSEAPLLRVLTTLHDARSEELFWARILHPHANDVRAAALQGLGGSVPATEKRLQALLTCAGEKDFQIVAAALMILRKVPVNAKNSKHWIKLLESPDVATRRFAVEKLQGIENAEVARGMLSQLRHPDRTLRDEALRTLLAFDAGRTVILEEILEAADIERTWFLARALAPSSRSLSSAQRGKLFAQAAKYHEAEDRHAAPLFFLLREMDHAWTRDQLVAKAQELRKKKKYAAAINYFRLLAQDPACSEETRFELAATGLKESTHDLSADHRNTDPSLNQFARLLQNAGFDLIGHVTKAKWLEPQDLFYLGFHFAEQSHRAKDFGKQVLELVAQRVPKADLGKQAKRKLKSEALA